MLCEGERFFIIIIFTLLNRERSSYFCKPGKPVRQMAADPVYRESGSLAVDGRTTGGQAARTYRQRRGKQ
jgi:hypothetical protein